MGKVPPLPLEEAQTRLLALASPLAIEQLDVEHSVGRYLAEPLCAMRTQPAADLSAMDGYAVRDDDLAGPWSVIGESAAGHPCGNAVERGQAIRIATGALLPQSAGCVILQEDITRSANDITLHGQLPVPPSKHIRRKGLDFANGDTVLPLGSRIGPAQVALAISAGHAQLPVRRPPRIAIIDSGDELSNNPERLAEHQIPASNGAMLLAMVNSLACDAHRIGPVADKLNALTDAFAEAADCDIIVTSGGASVGDHDLVRPALEAVGAQIDFWRIAIKPGKPLLVATRQRAEGPQIILGLPGNPVSSHVTAYLFLLPLVRTLLGAAAPVPKRFLSRLGGPVRANGKRREFLRGVWDGQSITVQTVQDSGALASLAASNVLIDRPAQAPAGQSGDEVFAYLLQNGGIA
ncbi:MAG: molybdopterin molybdotransferase MoeA [Sphingomonadaceae bacterium]|nr:molybdopterin molybdotransferase MoeA [Sphingomonadaceae bacterium]